MDYISLSYNNIEISPAPTLSYQTELLYNNDIVVGYQYNITLNGYCLKDGGLTTNINQARLLNNIFSSNGGFIKLAINNIIVLYAVDIKVQSIVFNESSNNWAGFIPYTIQLSSNHLHLGSDINFADTTLIEFGISDAYAFANFHSPNMINIYNHKLKTFNENFSMNVDDNIYNKVGIYNDHSQNGAAYNTLINNNYFTINYSISATGKNYIINNDNQKMTLPAWEHAKRWVHRRLQYQLNNMYNGLQLFMGVGEYSPLTNSHNDTPPPLVNTPSFALYNETLNFNVSESEGSFGAEYSAIAKQNCTTPYLLSAATGCRDATLHNITKKISKQYNSNQELSNNNQEISITIDGQIQGLMPAGGIRGGLQLADLGTGSFLTTTNNNINKNMAAQTLLNDIFDFTTYDFNSTFKQYLGITAEALQTNPNSTLKPSKMNLTRNYLAGTINYSAEYNNKYNCPTNHFDISISVEQPVPIIKEFIIPNNNDENTGDGFSVIQKLGTQTAKKINVRIEGNTGDDFQRCCLGYNDNWNLLAYNYFSLTDFYIPPEIVLPEISDQFVLTSRSKQVSFPDGAFTINLSYTCSDVCSIS